MNCEQALSAFASHLDGEELAAGGAESLDAHLAGCEVCRAQAKQLATTHRDLLMLRATEARAPKLEPVATPEEHRPAVTRPSQTTPRHSFWIEAAAAVVLAAILAFLLWPKDPPIEKGADPRKITQAGLGSPSRAGQVAAPRRRVGQVTTSQGRVEGRTSGTAAPVVLGPGAELLAGQEIHIAQDSFAELDMQSGVRVRLESLSVLRFGAPGEPDGVMLSTGKGRFEVTARDRPWRLQTPGATVESRGGVFVVTVKQ